MRIIEAAEVFRRLTMSRCIALMREMFTGLETERYIQPPRTIHRLPRGNLFGFMPAYLGDNDYFGAKVLDAFMTNKGTGYPSHMGYVMLFEATHGRPVGLVDATSITQIRTGAVSAVATDLLARQDAGTLALIGAGAQARAHLEAIRLVRNVESVRVYDVVDEAARRFGDEMERQYAIPIHVCGNVESAVSRADIVCTLTPGQEPYLQAEWIAPGTHINAVGAFSPTKREITSSLMARVRLFADQMDAMRRESGEYLIPLGEGVIEDTHIQGSVGQVLLGTRPGRTAPDDITLFDALGLAVEDVLCARALLAEEA